MNENKKLMSGIKSKLIAAICMLLVAVIMVVSSTYAWFTLSTAPEVTGITTNVGANGALEMMLVTLKDGSIDYVTGTTTGKTIIEKNKMWGNIVDVSDSSYGLDQITLMPSKFEPSTSDGKSFIPSAILKTPKYGFDGRVEDVIANAFSGTFSDAKFTINNNMGVRAVGVSSGMTDRQIAYRNARSAASDAANQALGIIKRSMQTNGSALASIAMNISLNDNATLTAEEIAQLSTMIADINASIASIEMAYKYHFVAMAASNAVDTEDAYIAIQNMVETNTLSEIVSQVRNLYSGEHFTTVEGYINKLETTKNQVTTSSGMIALLDTTSTSSDIKNAISPLLHIDNMKFAGTPLRDLINDMDFGKIDINNLVLEVETGGGVYADIADHCGSYEAEITLKNVSYNNMSLNGFKVTMKVTSTKKYLDSVSSAVSKLGAPAGNAAGAADQPITEFYGYIIDLAFRTNASSSNLLLQTDAVDRIYDDNNNVDTQGSGSSMTFDAVTGSGLGDKQIKNLMKCFRIVFFRPTMGANAENTGEILAYARLDVDHATGVADGWNAKMYLCDANGNFIMDGENHVNTITALGQNEIAQVSILVYLDGEALQNSDVSATTTKSITGKMNVQFASSAELKPAENGDLHQTGTSATAQPEVSPEVSQEPSGT